MKRERALLMFPVWGGFVFESLCNLYNWRYKNLGNLPHVQLLPEFSTANAGLLYDFQLINVEDFQGVGESEPNPYFYQVRKKQETFKFISYFPGLLTIWISITEPFSQPLNKGKLDFHLTDNTHFSVSNGLKIYIPKKRNSEHTRKKKILVNM